MRMPMKRMGHNGFLRKVGGGEGGWGQKPKNPTRGGLGGHKSLPKSSRRDSQALERFLREARAASALNHPGICTIHAIEEHDGRTFIAMELLEGQTLDKLIPCRLPSHFAHHRHRRPARRRS